MSTEVVSIEVQHEPLVTRIGRTVRRAVITPFVGMARIVRWALGSRPGAYWMIPLWVALVLALHDVLIRSSLNDDYPTHIQALPQPLLLLFGLPIAIVAAC